MNLFKRTTASVALVALVSGLFSTGVSAAYTADAANYLASKNVINTQSDVANYNLNSMITRGEMAKVAANLANVTPNTTCTGEFADVTATTPNTWVCGYVEALLDDGLVSANANYNPSANISKSEATKLMLSAAGYKNTFTDASKWQEQVVAFAASKGLVSTYSDYNTSAQRGFVFDVAAAAHKEVNSEDDSDLLGDLLDGLTGDDKDTDETDDSTTTPVVSGTDDLTVTLAASTPKAATIPGAISGLPVAAFDVTAGDTDVTVSSIVVKRSGLSNKDTLTSIAVFTEEGRASKGKNDSQENDTEANLILSDGGVVVKAGETTTLTLVADVASSNTIKGHEFALTVKEVVASASVVLASDLTANTFTVGGVDAPTITIEQDGSVSDPKIGEEKVELLKFQVEGASDEDVTLNTITFKSSDNDVDEDFRNFVLINDDKEVAAVSESNGKYVTFKLNEGVVIREDKNEKFVVKADIIAGAGDVFEFFIDKKLDVTAEGSKFGFGASVNISAIDEDDTTGDKLNKFTVQAGKLTLIDVDAPADKIRADKKNVVLGSIKVRNVAGRNLELQKFGVRIEMGSHSSYTGNLVDVLENIEARINGSAYELESSNTASRDTVYSDTDLNVLLPQGDVEIIIEADTKKDVPADVTFDLEITGTNGSTQFEVVETEDDKTVTDVTPSSLSFKKLTVISAGAKAAAIPLANAKVVKGAKDSIIAQFEVEAEEASLVTVDEVKVNIASTGTAALNKQVSKVALYKGSVAEANLLDDESSIASDGTVTFNSFVGGKVSIAAKAKQTFVVTVDVVDGEDVVGKVISASVTSVSAEDDDSDDVTVSGLSLAGGKNLTVENAGEIKVTKDAGNDANKDVKTILAGNSAVVFSADIQAQNEEADVEEVVFTLKGDSSDLKKAITTASLYLDGKLIDTNSNSEILSDSATGTISFTNLSNFIVPQKNVEVELKINTANIGFEKVGKALSSLKVDTIILKDIDGVDSGKTIANLTTDVETSSEEFSVVPAVVTPSVATSLNSSSAAEIKVSATAGNNTNTGSNSTPDTTVNSLTFDISGTSYASGTTLTLVNTDDTAENVTATIVGNNSQVSFDLTSNASLDNIISNGGSENYRITVPAVNDATLSLRLIKTGVNYSVSGETVTTNLVKDIDFGSRKY